MSDKLLAEWFWTDRWIGSSAFGLSIEARGLYREMLTQAWRRGARLPNDPDQVRRMAGVTMSEWRRTWPLVERFWRVEGDSLVNDTQLEIYADATVRTQRASARGLSGAQARHKQRLGSAQAPTQAPLEHKPPSPSLSPSPVERTERVGGAPIHTTHKHHAACGRVCVPAQLHTEFVQSRHHDGADAELREWYSSVNSEWTEGARKDDRPGGNAFVFWRLRFDERWPSTVSAKKGVYSDWKPRERDQ